MEIRLIAEECNFIF